MLTPAPFCTGTTTVLKTPKTILQQRTRSIHSDEMRLASHIVVMVLASLLAGQGMLAQAVRSKEHTLVANEADASAGQLKPDYGEASYWEQRYQADSSTFEWFYSYDSLRPILDHYFQQHDTLLHAGVGTSMLQYDMVMEGGYQHIVNTDISETAIVHLQQMHTGIPQLQYMLSDARHMPEFADETFDGVLDKSTLDAMLCGDSAEISASQYLQEVYRVLKPQQYFVLITHGPPFARLPWLTQLPGFDWQVNTYTITKNELGAVEVQGPELNPSMAPDDHQGLRNTHYVYVCCKQCGGGLSSRDSSGWDFQLPPITEVL